MPPVSIQSSRAPLSSFSNTVSSGNNRTDCGAFSKTPRGPRSIVPKGRKARSRKYTSDNSGKASRLPISAMIPIGRRLQRSSSKAVAPTPGRSSRLKRAMLFLSSTGRVRVACVSVSPAANTASCRNRGRSSSPKARTATLASACAAGRRRVTTSAESPRAGGSITIGPKDRSGVNTVIGPKADRALVKSTVSFVSNPLENQKTSPRTFSPCKA